MPIWKRREEKPSGPSIEEIITHMKCPMCGADNLMPTSGLGYLCLECSYEGDLEESEE